MTSSNLLKQALLASRAVIISTQICVSKLQRVLTLGDKCWLPTEDRFGLSYLRSPRPEIGSGLFCLRFPRPVRKLGVVFSAHGSPMDGPRIGPSKGLDGTPRDSSGRLGLSDSLLPTFGNSATFHLRWAKSCDSYRRIASFGAIAAIRITSVRWRSYLPLKTQNLVLVDCAFVELQFESRDWCSVV